MLRLANVVGFTGEAHAEGGYHQGRRASAIYTGSERSDAGFVRCNPELASAQERYHARSVQRLSMQTSERDRQQTITSSSRHWSWYQPSRLTNMSARAPAPMISHDRRDRLQSESFWQERGSNETMSSLTPSQTAAGGRWTPK